MTHDTCSDMTVGVDIVVLNSGRHIVGCIVVTCLHAGCWHICEEAS